MSQADLTEVVGHCEVQGIVTYHADGRNHAVHGSGAIVRGRKHNVHFYPVIALVVKDNLLRELGTDENALTVSEDSSGLNDRHMVITQLTRAKGIYELESVLILNYTVVV